MALTMVDKWKALATGEAGYFLGVDIGSTTTRCVLFSRDGTPVAEAYREPRVYYPQPGWAEVEPEDWWASTVEAIREVLGKAPVTVGQIAGLGLSGLLHALVPIDCQGKPLARAMLWLDHRCQPQVDWMLQEHGDLVRETMGNRWKLTTTMSAPKVRWLFENEPEIVRRTCTFLSAKDFVCFKLTGRLVADPSVAIGTALYDQTAKTWSRQMLELVGISPEQMPPIFDSTDLAGSVTEAAAQATCLAPGMPVVVGGGDTTCTLIGANAFDPKRACLYMGTAAWVSIPTSASGNVMGATSTTGASLKWLANLFRVEIISGEGAWQPYAALVHEAADSPPGCKGLVFLPHLMGERGPYYDPDAKGVLFGLSLAHSRKDVIRAVLEGCALQLRLILETLGPCQIEEVIAVGGGVKSSLWRSIIADVIGIPVVFPETLEAAALGAAILAGVGVGVYDSVQGAAGRLVRVAGRHEPDKARHNLYDEVYCIFLDLEKRVAPLYPKVPVRCSNEG
jgi:xylulokinase